MSPFEVLPVTVGNSPVLDFKTTTQKQPIDLESSFTVPVDRDFVFTEHV